MKQALRYAAPLAAVFLCAPIAAKAQNAILADDTALRAGPGYEYPRVAFVPEDARVYIHGCIDGFVWCDVSWRGERGWVDARNLSYSWNNRYVIVQDWGPRIGLPVVGFSVQDYWTRYYRDRPWWNQRYTWFERDGNWRDGDRWRDRDRWDRDGRREEWREGQREDRRLAERNEWRSRETNQWRDRTDDQRTQRQGGNWTQREERGGRQLDQNGGARMERNRGGDNLSTGRVPQRQQGAEERM